MSTSSSSEDSNPETVFIKTNSPTDVEDDKSNPDGSNLPEDMQQEVESSNTVEILRAERCLPDQPEKESSGKRPVVKTVSKQAKSVLGKRVRSGQPDEFGSENKKHRPEKIKTKEEDASKCEHEVKYECDMVYQEESELVTNIECGHSYDLEVELQDLTQSNLEFQSQKDSEIIKKDTAEDGDPDESEVVEQSVSENPHTESGENVPSTTEGAQDESKEGQKRLPSRKKTVCAAGTGVWAQMDSPVKDVCFIEDYFKLIVHTLKNGKPDSPVQSDVFKVFMDETVRRCHVMIFHTKIGKPAVFSSLIDKYKDILTFAKWLKTAFIGGYEDIVSEIAAASVLITNQSNIDRIGNEASWEIGSVKLNMSKRRLKPVFNINLPVIEGNKANSDSYKRTCLLLSPADMVQRHIPVPVGRNRSQCYKTKGVYSMVTEKSPILGLDIEGTSQPIRVTIVEESDEAGNNRLFYDKFVQSSESHRTEEEFFSRFPKLRGTDDGEKMMKDVKKSVQDVRQDLYTILPKDGILAMHSGNNDLIALGICHAYVMDTQSLFTSVANPDSESPSLKQLALEVLSIEIQRSSKHCSREDSTATIKLVERKLQSSIQFMNKRLLDTLHEPTLPREGEGTVMISAMEKTVENIKKQLYDIVNEATEVSNLGKNMFYHPQKSITMNDMLLFLAETEEDSQLTVTEYKDDEDKDDSIENCCAKICNAIELVYSGLKNNSLCIAFLLSDSDENIALMSVK